MKLIKEVSGWKFFKGDNLNDYTIETPDGTSQYYKNCLERTFDDAVKRGWIWVDREYLIGEIINNGIQIDKRKKQVRSDKLDLFIDNHHIEKESVIEKLNPILVKAKEKFEVCSKKFLSLQNELDFDINYQMLGDTHGIYEDYLYISFTMDGIYCRFELEN